METSIGTIVFKVKEKIEFLVMKRSNNQMWDLPKGHFKGDTNESEGEVAKRELEEETQITDVELLQDFRYEYDFVNPKGSHRQIIMFLGKTDQEPTLCEEHTEYRWVNFEEACVLMKYPEKVKLFESAKEHLLKHNYILK